MIAKTIKDLKNDKTLISRKKCESKFPKISTLCGTYFGSKVLCSFITQSVNVPIFAVHCLKNEKKTIKIGIFLIHYTVWKNEKFTLTEKTSNQIFSSSFSKHVTFTKFLSKMCESKFPHCVIEMVKLAKSPAMGIT